MISGRVQQVSLEDGATPGTQRVVAYLRAEEGTEEDSRNAPYIWITGKEHPRKLSLVERHPIDPSTGKPLAFPKLIAIGADGEIPVPRGVRFTSDEPRPVTLITATSKGTTTRKLTRDEAEEIKRKKVGTVTGLSDLVNESASMTTEAVGEQATKLAHSAIGSDISDFLFKALIGYMVIQAVARKV